jgi:hypothetical protein
VKSSLVAFAAGFYLISLSPTSANISVDASIDETPVPREQRQHTSCRLVVKRVCALSNYRDCRRITSLVCDVD